MKKDVEIIYNYSKLLGFKKKIKSKQKFFLKKILFIAALIILVIKIYKEKNNTKLNEKEIISEPIVPKKMYKKLETKFESSEFNIILGKNLKIEKYLNIITVIFPIEIWINQFQKKKMLKKFLNQQEY